MTLLKRNEINQNTPTLKLKKRKGNVGIKSCGLPLYVLGVYVYFFLNISFSHKLGKSERL